MLRLSLNRAAVIAALVFVLVVPMQAQAAPITKIFSSGDINVPIDDAALDPALPGYVLLGLTSVELPVAELGTIVDVNLRLRVGHVTDASPLAALHGITLSAPGEDAPLVSISSVIAEFGSGPTGCGGTLGVIDDEATAPLAGSPPPFAGSYRPENPFSEFDGLPMNGTWDLTFFDLQPSVVGPIYCWELEITYEPPAADLFVRGSDSPDPVKVGKKLKYTITVGNDGPGTASGVTLVDTLPKGAGFVSAKASRGSCNRAGRKVTCNIGDLAAGEKATVTITLKAPTKPGQLTNVAAVRSDNTDPVASDNRAQLKTKVKQG